MNGEGLRDRKKRQTRAALSRAALTLAAERGLDHVTVEDISTAAGVSPRTFFNYFAGKEEAVAGPDPEVGPRVGRRVVEQPVGSTAVDAVKAALLAEVAEVPTDERDLWLLRMRVVQQHPVLLARLFAGGEEAERHLVAGIAERVGLDATDLYPMLLAAAAGAACRVAFTRWFDPDDPRPLATLLADALDLLSAGLANPPNT
ncbi:AcrR family transcriptional regulator [Saccharothrix tamanrassetensis]|uniref:AcrR family transcriptional regulator n=1 Tax=Saccharothrix tamanrassetensis TaxID=1051531 RepID=A0A841CJ55_9PSEU|nr:TetR family transcriptional regulator [Saccharothrix tamanrassetensis]MBB5957013.1 AcrR family transcriptional regulator [Saccharothrix tamanrassetensis]